MCVCVWMRVELMACAPRIKCLAQAMSLKEIALRDAPRSRRYAGRTLRIITFSKHHNKLRRAANDSRLVTKPSLIRARDPLNLSPCLFIPLRSITPRTSLSHSPQISTLIKIACACATSGSRLARRRTSTTGLFIRESNYASSSLGFIAGKPPAAATTALRFNATLHPLLYRFSLFLEFVNADTS